MRSGPLVAQTISRIRITLWQFFQRLAQRSVAPTEFRHPRGSSNNSSLPKTMGGLSDLPMYLGSISSQITEALHPFRTPLRPVVDRFAIFAHPESMAAFGTDMQFR